MSNQIAIPQKKLKELLDLNNIPLELYKRRYTKWNKHHKKNHSFFAGKHGNVATGYRIEAFKKYNLDKESLDMIKAILDVAGLTKTNIRNFIDRTDFNQVQDKQTYNLVSSKTELGKATIKLIFEKMEHATILNAVLQLPKSSPIVYRLYAVNQLDPEYYKIGNHYKKRKLEELTNFKTNKMLGHAIKMVIMFAATK